MTTHRVAAVQMASGSNVTANLAEAARQIDAAAGRGAKLVALPEFFAMMGAADEEVLAIAETPGSGPIQEFLSEQSGQHKVWLLGGTIPLTRQGTSKVRAASCLYDDQGRCRARYDKMHLFDVIVEGDAKRTYSESRLVEPGTDIVVVDTPFGRLGLAVCYDLRFPELFRIMAVQGMELLALPSAFTAMTGKAHWEPLLRARAIENFCYVIAPAQGGIHVSGRETHGDTMVVDPWGTVLSRLPKGPGIIVTDVDLQTCKHLRKTFPAIDHIRLSWKAP
jgi:nitrilase